MGDAAEHAEGVSLVGWGFQTADLLLGGMQLARQLLLRKARLFAQRGELQGHVPGLARLFKPLRKYRVFQLFFQIKVKIGFFHISNLSCQSRIRSRAVSRSRVGIPWPLLRMP